MSAKPRRWPRILAGIASVTVLIFTGMAGVGAVAYRNFDANISNQAIDSIQTNGTNAGVTNGLSGQPLNILVTGTDLRVGEGNEGYGDPTLIEGARSDTTLLVHITADRRNALAVSIPRDTLVEIPACEQMDGSISEPVPQDRFNEAFRIGGIGCTIDTLEEMTGVKIDHFVVVDFNGFKGVVDALDGVEVCVNQPVDDPLSGLKLPAGYSVVKGEDALAFVRARYTVGDGSDISRIDRQQAFLASAIRKATSLGVLSNPVTTYRLLDSATRSLFTDTGLGSLADLTDLAVSMSDMQPSDISFVTAPYFYNDDGATVSLDQAAAEPLWAAMREDMPWPPEPTVPAGDTEPLTVPPRSIRVQVLNGTGVPGTATEAATALTRAGYEVVEIADYTGAPVTETMVIYPAGAEEAARTLAYATDAATSELGDPNAVVANPTMFTGATDAMSLVIGPEFDGAHPVFLDLGDGVGNTTGTTDSTEPNSDPDSVAGRDASEVICS